MKISSGEVISHPVGYSFVYSAALLWTEKQEREPGVVGKQPFKQVGDWPLTTYQGVSILNVETVYPGIIQDLLPTCPFLAAILDWIWS